MIFEPLIVTVSLPMRASCANCFGRTLSQCQEDHRPREAWDVSSDPMSRRSFWNITNWITSYEVTRSKTMATKSLMMANASLSSLLLITATPWETKGLLSIWRAKIWNLISWHMKQFRIQMWNLWRMRIPYSACFVEKPEHVNYEFYEIVCIKSNELHPSYSSRFVLSIDFTLVPMN